MSVHFISGAPGGGKSLYGMRLIVGELTVGSRPIITNVAVKLGELNAYLQDRFPKIAVNLHLRLRIIDSEDLGIFFLRRMRLDGMPLDLLPVTKEDESKGKRPDYSTVEDNGVFYVLDEIHEKFNARAWMETGRSCLHYLSQHRKLGDDVVCITQAVGNVDKQFRSVAQDYTTITNLSKRKVSVFRMPPLFMRRVYPVPPTGMIAAMETGTFTLDVTGLAQCYDTARGVGLHGKLADTKARRKGISLVWAGAFCALLLVGALVMPRILAKRLVGPMHGVVMGERKEATNLVSSPLVSRTAASTIQTIAPVQATVSVETAAKVKCVGYYIDHQARRVNFSFDDGSLRKEALSDCQYLGDDYVVFRGQSFKMAKAEISQGSQRMLDGPAKSIAPINFTRTRRFTGTITGP